MFELVVIKPKTAKIGVAGGAFADGKLLVLKMDKSITLVNTATGARYQIKLVYTGTTPETVEGFTAGIVGRRHVRSDRADDAGPRPSMSRPRRSRAGAMLTLHVVSTDRRR